MLFRSCIAFLSMQKRKLEEELMRERDKNKFPTRITYNWDEPLVTRLRQDHKLNTPQTETMREAADYIEGLLRLVKHLEERVDYCENKCAKDMINQDKYISQLQDRITQLERGDDGVNNAS